MSQRTYEDLIASKLRPHMASGVKVASEAIHPRLFPFQSAITRWALRMGRAAIFADAGLGKTACQLEWAQQVHLHTGGNVLIYAPLTIAAQTIAEGRLQGVDVTQVRYPEEIAEGTPGVFITNYDRYALFMGLAVEGVVLDEGSILKSSDGKTRTALVENYQNTPFRLVATATPAPNDHSELANYSEFLSMKSRVEMLATFFIHESDGSGWRLKEHGVGDFYRWLASWAVFLRKPSDIGYEDTGYNLPPLHVRERVVQCEAAPEGFLFATGNAHGIKEISSLRRNTLAARVEEAARLVEAEPDKSWILWVDLNGESEALQKRLAALPLVCVEGNQSEEEKVAGITAFLERRATVMITKPSVASMGLNLQVCPRQAFVGFGFSYEKYYQAVRRSWRFGQPEEVHAYIVVSESERSIVETVRHKEEEAKIMGDRIIENIGDLNKAALEEAPMPAIPPGFIECRSGADWKIFHGDCVEVLGRADLIPDDSIGFSIQSPPFATLYTYSDNPRDMGNSRDHDEFFQQFQHYSRNLMRVMMPGRIVALHVAQVGSTQATHGRTGLFDFRGPVIDTFLRCGWNYYREVCIDRCPQAVAIRTKQKCLMFTQLKKDRSWSGPAIPDYVLIFKKPGDNPAPICNEPIDNETWIQWARPIWYNVRETRTLNVAEARSEKDTKHICPLSLDIIQRSLLLWSNEGDRVLSSFAGIGSEGYESILNGRLFTGIELKPEYFETACKNLRRAEQMRGQQSLFAGLEEGA